MALTEAFKDAVQNGDKLGTKIMIKDIMIIDPSLKDYDEMIRYAEENIGDLYDVHDGEVLKNDPLDWTEDYLDAQMVVVIGNFSKERLTLLKKIVQKLYYKPQPKQTVRHSNGSSRKHANDSVEWSTKKKVGVALAVTGGVIAVAGIGTANLLATAGGLGIGAVGAGVIISDKER